jgi:hypothetical protein
MHPVCATELHIQLGTNIDAQQCFYGKFMPMTTIKTHVGLKCKLPYPVLKQKKLGNHEECVFLA